MAMTNKHYCGLDFHKNFTQICVMNEKGHILTEERIKTPLLTSYVANKNYIIGIEASGGVFDIAEKLEQQGHIVRIINPCQFKAIGIGGKKTDKNDAKAIATALRMDCIPEVKKKNLYSRKLKSLLKSRDFLVKSRTAFICHLRAILREYGLVMPAGVENFYNEVVEKINIIDCPHLRKSMFTLLDQVSNLKNEVEELEKEIYKISKEDERVKRLQTVPGIGPLTAVAFVAIIEDAKYFDNANKLSSYLGLVPREFSSGDKQRFVGITKAGSEILRRYLIHGARSYMRYVSRDNHDKTKRWAARLKDKSGMNKAVVAVAHKKAKICYALLRDGTVYNEKSTVAKNKKEEANKIAA
jgi:transposase